MYLMYFLYDFLFLFIKNKLKIMALLKITHIGNMAYSHFTIITKINSMVRKHSTSFANILHYLEHFKVRIYP